MLPRDVLMTSGGCRHTSTELTSLLSIELDSLRSFIFSNVSRDRGLRAILEASGAVLVTYAASAFFCSHMTWVEQCLRQWLLHTVVSDHVLCCVAMGVTGGIRPAGHGVGWVQRTCRCSSI